MSFTFCEELASISSSGSSRVFSFSLRFSLITCLSCSKSFNPFSVNKILTIRRSFGSFCRSTYPSSINLSTIAVICGFGIDRHLPISDIERMPCLFKLPITNIPPGVMEVLLRMGFEILLYNSGWIDMRFSAIISTFDLDILTIHFW